VGIGGGGGRSATDEFSGSVLTPRRSGGGIGLQQQQAMQLIPDQSYYESRAQAVRRARANELFGGS